MFCGKIILDNQRTVVGSRQAVAPGYHFWRRARHN